MLELKFEFEDFRRDLEKLNAELKKLDNAREIPLTDLLTPSFVSKRSRFRSIDELITASGLEFNSVEDFRATPGEQLDTFIAQNTKYTNFDEMVDEAMAQYVAEHLPR